MADESRISTQIEMLGAKEYRDALKGINADLKLLDSGLKASQSAFKDLDGADALADRLEGLNKQYDKHRQKVQLITRQLEAAKAKYGENSQQVRTLQTALNTATTAMNRCGHEIDDTQEKLNELQDGEKDAGKQAEKMAKEMEKSTKATKEQGREADKSTGLLGKLGSSMLSVAKGAAVMTAAGTVAFMVGTAEAAKKATTALINCAGAGAAFADDMLTMSTKTGISLDMLQKLNYAAPLVDTDLQTMTDAMVKLTKKMGDMDKSGVKASDAITQMGLTIYDASGNLKSSEDMFWEIIYALGQIENPTERDAAAMELFGKSAQDLNPLIEASTKGIRELGDEAEGMGVILTTEAMNTLGEYQNSLDRFNNVWEGFKHQLGANVSGLFKPFVDDATGAVAEVNNLLKDGWQDTDADALVKILGGVWDTFVTDARQLWNKVSPIISELLSSIKTYLSENLPKMLSNVGALIKTAIGDLTEVATSLIDGIDWGKVGTLLNDLLIGAAGVFSKLVEKLPQIFKNIEWGDVFKALVDLADTAVKAILECFGIDWKGVTAGWNELVTECQQLWEDVKAIWNGVGAFFGGVAGSIASFFEKAWHDIKAAWTGVKEFFSNLFDGLGGWLDAAVGDLGQWAKDKWNSIKSAWSNVSSLVSSGWKNFTKWVDDRLGISTWAKGVWDGIKDTWTVTSDFVSAAWGSITGWIDEKLGLSEWGEKIKKSLTDIWNTAAGAVKDAFKGIGEWFEGIWITIVNTAIDALNSLISSYNSVAGVISDGLTIDELGAYNPHAGERSEGADTRQGRRKGGTSTVSYDISGWHEDAKAMLKDFREAMQQFFEAGALDAQTNGREMAEKYIASFCNGAYAGNPEMIAVFTQVFNEIVGKAEETADSLEGTGESAATNLAKGILNKKSAVTTATSQTMSAAQGIASRAAGGFNSIGIQVAAGLANGIAAGASRAVAAVQSLCNSIIAAGQGTLKIGSPSKVFEWMGEMSGQGYQIGLENSMAGIDALGGLNVHAGALGGSGANDADGIDYNRLGEAVVSALRREGVGEAVLIVDGKELGRSTERGVSAENYDRQVSGYKGRSAALKAV